MSAPPLSDRQRVELALPARMLYALVLANCFAPTPGGDKAEADEEVRTQVARLGGLLKVASIEPIEGLAPRDAGKIARRIDRVAVAIGREWDQAPALSIALTLHYFLADLLDRGILELWEGSAMGDAVTLFFPMFEHGFDERERDEAARKRARKLLRRLQGEGYYREAPAAQTGSHVYA